MPAGVEDTNALALAPNIIAAQLRRPLAKPQRTYITGRSMGEHVASATVKAETLAAVNRYRFHAALPMFEAVADVELFNRFNDMQVAAQTFAGVPDRAFVNWADVHDQISSSLFASFPTATSPTIPNITTANARNLSRVLKTQREASSPCLLRVLNNSAAFVLLAAALAVTASSMAS